MRQSQLFTKTLRQDPRGEISANAKLLERGGFIYKNSSGVYSYLPLGFRVLKKMENIIEKEMNLIGAEELLMPNLIEKKYWESTGRWNVDVMYKLLKEEGNAFGLGWTHEEVITEIARSFIHSYKDLPKAVYQIQTKFRDEPRARSGLLRGREFLMKDLYSFHEDENDRSDFYNKVMRSYEEIIKTVGLEGIWVEAGGGEFTESITHELQILTQVGEDTVFYCEKCHFAQNKEVASIKSEDQCPKCGGGVKQSNAIEAGNVFNLGTKYSIPIGLFYKDKGGNSKPVVMGSYGIGPSRLMATVVEMHHDEKGVAWPEAIAPFNIHLVALLNGEGSILKFAEMLYKELEKNGVSVLFDDRTDESPGEKFADSDLIGIPYRAVVSEKTVKAGKIELKKRAEEKGELVNKEDLFKIFLRHDK